MNRLINGIVLGGLALAVAFLCFGSSGADTIPPGTPIPQVGQLGGPARELSNSEQDTWRRGRAIFDRDWHRDQGLGPTMNADSCRSCHEDPVVGGAGGLDLNVFRFGNDNGGAGPFTTYPGGQIAKKLVRADMPTRPEADPAADVFEQRQTPSILGLGLLESIPEATITALQDPGDSDMDGVIGVARMIDVGGGVMELGRFGWKAQVPRLSDFARDAIGVEIGITTASAGRGFAVTSDSDPEADPEADPNELADLIFFLENLGPPVRKGSTNPLVAQGEMRFGEIGCATCHVPTLMGANGPVNGYTNLLLHNVQASNFRGMEEAGAGVGMYRTPPLWGIAETAPYMHDGKATTLLDAILAHQGEASNSRIAFEALSATERESVILFLEDL